MTSLSIGSKYPFECLWMNENNDQSVFVLDQRKLPFSEVIFEMQNLDDVSKAISTMVVRGAGLIGVTAGFGIYLSLNDARNKGKDLDNSFEEAYKVLLRTRPTAVNLKYALDEQKNFFKNNPTKDPVFGALEVAKRLYWKDIEYSTKIAEFGCEIIENISLRKKGEVVNVLTHCNAGQLAFLKYGSALAPIYKAKEKGIAVHVWVEETRPRNQGAGLTVWELNKYNIDHTLITDNAGGIVLQQGFVDLCITGADRVAPQGDVCNKIGTYKTALACKDNKVPFYVAFPSSTFDFKIKNAYKEIPIEERCPTEVTHIWGKSNDKLLQVALTPPKTQAKNYGFDITHRTLIEGLITDRGVCRATESEIKKLYPRETHDVG